MIDHADRDRLLEALRRAIDDVACSPGYGEITVEISNGTVRDVHVKTQFRGLDQLTEAFFPANAMR